MGVANKKVKHNPLKQRIESNFIKLIPAKRVEDAELFLELIHQNSNGFIAISTKDKKHGYPMSQYSFDYKEIKGKMNQFLDLEDIYISMNSFRVPNRQSKNIFQLNLFWIDLDYYKVDKYKNKTQKEMIEILRKDGMFDKLEPSFFVDSGNGLYIMYLINDVPKQVAKFWTRIEKELVNRFIKYGADTGATDISRILRIPGSKNSKTGKYANIIKNNNIRYELLDVASSLGISNYTPKIIDENKLEKKRIAKAKSKKQYKESGNKNKVITFNNLKNANYRRMLDLRELQNLRHSKDVTYREYSSFLYMLSHLHYYRDIERAKKDVKAYNNGFKEPLEQSQIENEVYMAIEYYENYVKCIEVYDRERDGSLAKFLYDRQCMLYSTDKIIKVLNITDEEMKYLKTLVSKEIKYDKKKEVERIRYANKLKEEGKLTKKERMNLDIKKVKELLAEGLSLAKIAEILNISKSTVKRYKNRVD